MKMMSILELEEDKSDSEFELDSEVLVDCAETSDLPVDTETDIDSLGSSSKGEKSSSSGIKEAQKGDSNSPETPLEQDAQTVPNSEPVNANHAEPLSTPGSGMAIDEIPGRRELRKAKT
jgi:hypothetical protein